MKYIINSIIGLFIFLCVQTYALNNTSSISITNDPRGFILTKDENRAYIATGRCDFKSGNAAQIDVVDLKAMKILGSINVPMDEFDCLNKELFLSSDEKKLYAFYGKGIVSIDTMTFKILNTTKIANDDFIENHHLMSPDKKKIYLNITTNWQHDYRNYFVFDTTIDSFVDKIPNTEVTCLEGCFGLAGAVISPDENYIYEMPEPYYQEPQRLVALNIYNKETLLLGTMTNRILNDGVILSKDSNTFYLSTFEENSPSPTEDWYIYAVDKNSMQSRELYHAEHEVRAIGLSKDEQQLYILDLRYKHKKISIVNTQTGTLIEDIPMSNLMMDAKVASSPNLTTIYFTTGPGGGQGSLFNVTSLNSQQEGTK